MIDAVYSSPTTYNDLLNTHQYTLSNGLTVLLTVNKDQPRISTAIAFKAGSKHDPSETTGLAHYMEHMLFKGTPDFGTQDWPKEKALLDQIEELYEQHLTETDPDKKAALYKKIDELSFEAAKIAVPNEYDKMVSSLGAKGTNAYTSYEKTVYLNDIPANELEKWLQVEANRFDKIVLRQFHTELETVYEEFNRTLDNDYRKSWKSLYAGLFPTHPYGIPVIGKGEHLKNPSMRNIYRFYEQYYRPNNAALVLSGDLDPDKTIALVEQYFGSWQAGEIPVFDFQPEQPITQPIFDENFGQQTEHMYLAYRFPGTKKNPETAMMLKLISTLLYNNVAGLIDIDLIQTQKVLQVGSFEIWQSDYCSHVLYGLPKQGQSLDEVRELLLAEIDKLKQGDFEEWMLEAVVNHLEYDQLRAFRNNRQRLNFLIDSFVLDFDYNFLINWGSFMKNISKEDIINFANEYYHDNYVLTYKRHGIDPNIPKVEKPNITPIPINRDASSAFYKEFKKKESPRLKPKFLDFDKDIQHDVVNMVEIGTSVEKLSPLYTVKNNIDSTFGLYFIWDFGKHHHKELNLAMKYFAYLATSKYNLSEFQKELFRYGLEIKSFCHNRKAFIYLTGLEKSLEKGVELFQHLLTDLQSNAEAYKKVAEGTLKRRADNKMNKDVILHKGLYNYAIYGETNPFNDMIPETELIGKDPNQLCDFIKNLPSYPFKIFYYGQKEAKALKPILKAAPFRIETENVYPALTKYTQHETTDNKVFFVNHEQTQVELVLVSKKGTYNKDLLAPIRIYNEYFGSGLSSIIFQEIREAKALAYSAYSVYSLPGYKDLSHFLTCYIGTQPDKLQEASDVFLDLMNNMPRSVQQFEAAKQAALKKIESERITHENIYWTYDSSHALGLDSDIRKQIYEQIKALTLDDLEQFFNTEIKGCPFNYLVLGKKELLDMSILEKLGPIQEMTLEEIFKY